MIKIKIINKSKNKIPSYQSEGASAVDLYADIKENIVIKKNSVMLIPTGLFIEIPANYEAQIRSRSGLALKNGVFCLNSPGTIDSDYRGEIGVILASFNEDYTVTPSERIAQMVFAKIEKAEFIEVSELDETKRGEGGFGSSGKI